LFEADQRILQIPITQKPLLVSLIERMLSEALADQGVAQLAASDMAREAGDEQDCA
jgi:hypothetical protein